MNCPSCGSRRTYVVHITTTDTGDRLRRRHCRACDHRWWAIQPPEREIDGSLIVWPKWRQGSKRKPVRIVPSEEDFNRSA